MNEELKTALTSQGMKVCEAVLRAETAKSALETFDANSRCAIKAADKPAGWAKAPTDDDTKALVLANAGRAPLVAARIEAFADSEGVKTDTQCLLAHVSLVCSETAAMSRISQ